MDYNEQIQWIDENIINYLIMNETYNYPQTRSGAEKTAEDLYHYYLTIDDIPEWIKDFEPYILDRLAECLVPDEPYFDRFDICEAHYLLESDYNISGVLQERPSNQRRKMSTSYQLHRMQFKPSLTFQNRGYAGLTDNGKAIYAELLERYGLEKYNVN